MTTNLQSIRFNKELSSKLELLSVNFKPAELIWINEFISILKSPTNAEDKTTFDEIISQVQEILKDGKIDIVEIPQVISIINKVYHTKALQTDLFDYDNILLLIKITIETLIDSDIIPLSENNKEIIDNIVNISLDLLRFNPTFVKEGSRGCLHFFGCL
jgi:hypothetical protein